MNLSYDKSVDALEIRVLDDALVARTEQVDAGTLVDLNGHGEVVAIEVIHPARPWPLEEILERFALRVEDGEMLRSLWTESGRYPFAEPTELGAEATGELLGV